MKHRELSSIGLVVMLDSPYQSRQSSRLSLWISMARHNSNRNRNSCELIISLSARDVKPTHWFSCSADLQNPKGAVWWHRKPQWTLAQTDLLCLHSWQSAATPGFGRIGGFLAAQVNHNTKKKSWLFPVNLQFIGKFQGKIHGKSPIFPVSSSSRPSCPWSVLLRPWPTAWPFPIGEF